MSKQILIAVSILGTLMASSSTFAAQQTVTLDVPGMTCSTCPITVKKALMKVEGIQQVKVNYERREAVVIFEDAAASVEKIQLATADSGYPSTVKVSN